ncbi:MAG: tRNA (5-methylaminomethyl-2-thiouridine)(34)-methyltransferase MnmD [Flavobacteriaceae bacterium]|jgi:tRNA U34 5-methylaminomethyl-2-thiouridine-forming methyltransferase MnmC|nr:tRNA (5-methylaminomethyl-2-thiouridine)(34)-methyltransferase MnmD [Flavobacteriaceae bacterium]
MKRQIKTTSDGSKTLYVNSLNESYHSLHGALNEAKHVFIDNGMKLINNYEINILELGFGTGLNVLAAFDEFLKNPNISKINYYAIEKYPVTKDEIEELGYHRLFEGEDMEYFYPKIHDSDWEKLVEIYPNFYLKKIKSDFFDLENLEIPPIDLVCFDCFGARVQPDLWEKPLFEMISKKMRINSLLTTYSSKGSVRRILRELGFRVEKKTGPPGKREMMVAIFEDTNFFNQTDV